MKENTEDHHSEKDEEKPFHLGKSQICNYVRINDFLFSDLKDLMDLGKLSIKSSVELSYLEEADQELVRDLINDGIRITDSKAKAIKKLSLDEGLTKESLERLLRHKDNEKKKLLKIPTILLKKYFGNKGEAEIIDILELALSKYFENSEK
ncbi:MAG: hypothetical protein CVU98_13025 [Firmicutes bacterium HGW-Firmicutes-3]|nr:MAG: hypothetical protein CVU98_13025 [Firmicutes bacterium HGW-Firmicutes-3]